MIFYILFQWSDIICSCLIAACLLFLLYAWNMPELKHTSPRKTQEQSSMSSNKTFELWKTE